MNGRTEALIESLRGHFGADAGISTGRDGQVTLVVDAAQLLDACTRLRDEPALHFEQAIDVCGVDHLAYGRDEWVGQSSTHTGFSRGVAHEDNASWAARSGERGTPRFVVVYHLLSVEHNRRLRVRCWCEDDELPMVPSVTGIWPSANWFEREAFDLFGILFDGHPDLRRILTDYGFIGHPFRKDFPLIGNVEVRYDPERGRVIYQPVSIEPRTLVPKIIRQDHRYEKERGDA